VKINHQKQGVIMDTLVSFAQSGNSDAAAGAAAGFFVMLWFGFVLLMVGLAIAGMVFWIISLVHVIQHDDVKDRILWLVLILVLGNIMGVIYFFAVKRPYDRGGARDPHYRKP